MKTNLREKSIELRKKGRSVKEIAEILSVAKGSVSTWVRDVLLTSEQKLVLKKKNHSPEVVEKRRQSRLRNESVKRNESIETAAKTIQKMTQTQLKILGIGLYWGEGGKTMTGLARISNSDPSVIMMSMRFFREICKVADHRFRAQIHIHSSDAVKDAEKYWSKVTGIPLSQFYKTYVAKHTKSKNVRKTLPYGTVDICICDTQLLLEILGWIEGVKRQVLS